MVCKKKLHGREGKADFAIGKVQLAREFGLPSVVARCQARAVAKRLSICCRGFKLVPESNWKIET